MSENVNETIRVQNSASERQIYRVTKELVVRAMRLVAIDVVH